MAAHGSSIAALQSSLTTGLSNKADQSAFDVLEGVVATKSTPDGVDLKLSNYSTTAAMNGSIASANNATLATVAANYGLKTVVDQHSLDIAARITPLEVDTKVANALLGAVTAAALASELASRDASISGLQASKPDASALTAHALQSAVDTSSEVDSKIATALLDAVTTAALDAALLSKADASALASLLSAVDGLDTPLEINRFGSWLAFWLVWFGSWLVWFGSWLAFWLVWFGSWLAFWLVWFGSLFFPCFFSSPCRNAAAGAFCKHI